MSKPSVIWSETRPHYSTRQPLARFDAAQRIKQARRIRIETASGMAWAGCTISRDTHGRRVYTFLTDSLHQLGQITVSPLPKPGQAHQCADHLQPTDHDLISRCAACGAEFA